MSSDKKAQLILAHGAGAGMHNEFMQSMQALLQAHRIAVHLFDFDYMQTMRDTGKRRPPDRMPQLMAAFERQLSACLPNLPMFIGGKSMGGRVASMLLQQSPAIGGICLGYPFHPPGKPDKLRTDHLLTLSKPLLIIQGQKDTFGKQSEVQDYPLSPSIHVHFLAEADHSFKPPKRSGFDQHGHMQQAAQMVNQFIDEQLVIKGEA